MKISRKDFQDMRAEGTEKVRQGKPALSLTGEITNQTSWLFFNREILEELLAHVDEDPIVASTQIFLAEYTDKTTKTLYSKSYKNVIGSLTIVHFMTNIEANVLTRVSIGDNLLKPWTNMSSTLRTVSNRLLNRAK